MTKKRVFEIVSKAEDGDRASKLFDGFIMALIALSIVSIVLESFETLASKYGTLFSAFEAVSVFSFGVEYILRIWTANYLYPDSKHPHFRYIVSFMAIIDLMAILPFFLPFISADMRFLRMFRLFRLARLLRVLKLGRYLEALQTIKEVVAKSASQLIMSIVICFFVMLFSSIIMYTVENPVQPEQFPDIIASFWWAICTLTTVGYGDVFPVTPLGKFFAAVISLVGIGIIAIPTGIISAGFISMIGKHDEEQKEPINYCPHCGHKLNR